MEFHLTTLHNIVEAIRVHSNQETQQLLLVESMEVSVVKILISLATSLENLTNPMILISSQSLQRNKKKKRRKR